MGTQSILMRRGLLVISRREVFGLGFSLKVTNTQCVHRCVYCYEHKVREAGNGNRPFSLEAMLAQLDKEWQMQAKCGSKTTPYLHGGEALYAGHEVVEVLLRRAYELAGYSSIQTSGYLIDDRYIEMFRRYKTSVGISIDGPWPLNKARVTPNKSGREVTDQVMKNIYRLRAEEIPVSIICVLHKLNALPDKLEILKQWLVELKSIGIINGRLNLMHSDHKRFGKAIELSEDEAAYAWRELTRFVLTEQDGLLWQPMRDAVSILMGIEQGTCIFGSRCSYYHASSEPVIFSDGTTGTCLKTSKSGHMYPRLEQQITDTRGFGAVRYELLPKVEQADGGCKGCRYWRECGGGCPAEGLEGGDWRNRTRFCKAYYALFDETEKLLRRLMPTIRLTPETTPEEYNGKKMRPHAFIAMDERYVRQPSSWRSWAKTEAITNARKLQSEHQSSNTCATSQNKPNGVRHLDHMDTHKAEG